MLDLPGKVSVMVRYQGRVAVFNAAIPLGAAVGKLPPAKNFVDAAVFANLKELGIPPSPVCDDATFLRRVTLDIAGRLPTEDEARAFLANGSAGQARPVDRRSCCAAPTTPTSSPSKWTAVLKNRRDDTSDIVSNFAFHAWVRDSLLANKPYDQFVRELLAATGTVIGNPPVAWYKRVKEPKEQIEDVAQLFLGRAHAVRPVPPPSVRALEPGRLLLAGGVLLPGRPQALRHARRGPDLPQARRRRRRRTSRPSAVLKPAALGDPMPPIAPDEDPRLRLADWMKAPEQPVLRQGARQPLLEALLPARPDRARGRHPRHEPAVESGTAGGAGKALHRERVRPEGAGARHHPLQRLPVERDAERAQCRATARTTRATTRGGCRPRCCSTRSTSWPERRPTSPTCRRARGRWRCRTTATTSPSPFLRVFGRPEGESVCECERVQSSNLAQSLHLINAADIRGKLAHPERPGRAAGEGSAAGGGEGQGAVPGRVRPRAAAGRAESGRSTT